MEVKSGDFHKLSKVCFSLSVFIDYTCRCLKLVFKTGRSVERKVVHM